MITDEAHRSQYDTFALNMRNALPNAAFIGFTGTPLMVGEEKTRQVFGDYVSIYNFRESVEDRATVPLYYENRIPEMQLTNADLNDDMETLLEDAELDEDQEDKLEREFARQYYIITDDDRLETVAEDIVSHFLGRGYQGKAMVVCIDKATAVRMYDKVRTALGRRELARAAGARWRRPADPDERGRAGAPHRLHGRDRHGGGRLPVPERDRRAGQEGRRHRAPPQAHGGRGPRHQVQGPRRSLPPGLRLRHVDDRLRRALAARTIYLDKPMRNHTLMQTIARANRVFGDKENGLIVDYVGVFRNLQKALAIYGTGSGGRVEPGDSPVADKSKLVEELRKALSAVTDFCRAAGFEPEAVRRSQPAWKKIALLDAGGGCGARDRTNRSGSSWPWRTGRSCFTAPSSPTPPPTSWPPSARSSRCMVEKIRSLAPQPDISAVEQQVVQLLEESIEAQGYAIEPARGAGDALGSAGPGMRRRARRPEQDRLRRAAGEVRPRSRNTSKPRSSEAPSTASWPRWCGSTAPAWTTRRSSRS